MINFNALNEDNKSEQSEQQAQLLPVKHDPLDPAPLLKLFDRFHAEIDVMELKASQHEVKDQQSNNAAVEMSLQTKNISQAMEKKRKEVKEPYLKVTSVLDNKVKTLNDRLENIQLGLNNKIRPYLQEQERIRLVKESEARRKAAEEQALIRKQLEEEARQRAEAEQARLDKELGDKAPVVEPEPVIVPEVVAPVESETKTTTQTGMAKLDTQTDWEIINFKELPDIIFEKRKEEIKKAISPQINAMIKTGITNIPGVRIFETVKLKTRVKR